MMDADVLEADGSSLSEGDRAESRSWPAFVCLRCVLLGLLMSVCMKSAKWMVDKDGSPLAGKSCIYFSRNGVDTGRRAPREDTQIVQEVNFQVTRD